MKNLNQQKTIFDHSAKKTSTLLKKTIFCQRGDRMTPGNLRHF